MREKLKNIEEVRGTFTGIFERYGKKNGWRGAIEETILLKEIKDINGDYVTDHLWFNRTKNFDKIGPLEKGDIIQFNARSKAYVKGYKGFKKDIYNKPLELDYKLSNPTKIKKIH